MPRHRPADRFRQLLAAAARIFIVEGYGRTQMQDVAEVLGVAKGTVYGYVESKSALLVSMSVCGLTRMVRMGVHPAQEARRSRVLLELDESHGRPAGRREIAGRVGVRVEPIRNVAKVYAALGGDVGATIRRKQRLTPPVEPSVPARMRWVIRLLRHVRSALSAAVVVVSGAMPRRSTIYCVPCR